MKQIIQNLIAAITGYLSNLTTTDKSNLVAAINEVKAGSGGGGAAPLVYIAYVTQSGTSAPTIQRIIANTLGANISSVYQLAGKYKFTDSNSSFVEGKTMLTFTPGYDSSIATGSTTPYITITSYSSSSIIAVATRDISAAGADDLLQGFLKIEVYS